MRRSICYSEPTTALAGERKTWKFIYTPGNNLPKGTVLRFDLGCKGRSIDWEIPVTHSKTGANLIWAELPNGKKISCEVVEVEDNIVPQYEFILPQEVAHSKPITICIGTPHLNKETTLGTAAQLTIQRRRPFYLFVDPTGKGDWPDPEVFSMDIKGNVLETIKILAPSQVVKNRRFDVVLRFEDVFGNLTNNAPENTLIELSHENLRDNLQWKLFLPETGYLAIPNLYFNETGVYTIRLKNVQSGEIFTSAPIKCFATEVKNVFWGSLHAESERFDSTETIESCLRHFRDEKSVNFYATSSPDTVEETPTDIWKSISMNIQEFNEEDRFVTFLGQQWTGTPHKEGLRLFLYAKDDRPIIRKADTSSQTLKQIYRLFSPKEMISIPIFSMSSISGSSFEESSPEFERVVEIYNAWGCSECSAKESNKYPISSKSKKGALEWKDGSIMNALKSNKRFGFVAGGLDDRASFAPLFETDQQQYSPGLTAILSETHSRAALFEALYNRNCYATTGERIIVGFSLAGHIMGSELSTNTKPGLHVNRHIEGYVAGTAPLKQVEIIRNGECLHSVPVTGTSIDFEFDDLTPLNTISLKDPVSKSLFSFYYIRVTQEDGHMAWGSPIWVDCVGDIKSRKRPASESKAMGSSPSIKSAALMIGEDEEMNDEFDLEEDEEEETPRSLPKKKKSPPKKIKR